MKKEDIKLGMIVVANGDSEYPFPLKGYSGKVTKILENELLDGTCIQVNEEGGYYFTPSELDEVIC